MPFHIPHEQKNLALDTETKHENIYGTKLDGFSSPLLYTTVMFWTHFKRFPLGVKQATLDI